MTALDAAALFAEPELREPVAQARSFRSASGGDTGFFSGIGQRFRTYFQHAWKEEYAPWNDLRTNGWGYIKNGLASWALSSLSNAVMPVSPRLGQFLDAIEDPIGKAARERLANLSPLLRTLVLSYAPGLSNIERVWVYVRGAEKYPIYFSTYQDPRSPSVTQLQDGIAHVERERESPFNKMARGESDALLNRSFREHSVDAFTAGCYKDHFEQEPERPHRWFATRFETLGQWPRDHPMEALLDPAVAAHVEVYRKPVAKSGVMYALGTHIYGDDRPRSGYMAMKNLLGSIPHHLIYLPFGIPLAALLERIGVEAPGIRHAMEETVYKPASRMAEGFGYNRWLTFER